MHEYTGIYEAIIEATNSELILFFIIIAIVVAVVVAPLYIAMLKERKHARQYERERDERVQVHERENRQQIIDVVKENSAVIASLKTTLDNNGASVGKALERVHTRLDGQDKVIRENSTDIAQINTKMSNVLDNQREMSSKINKIFVVANGGTTPPPRDGGGE